MTPLPVLTEEQVERVRKWYSQTDPTVVALADHWLRTQAGWVAWKPGDAMPNDGLYWTTWFDREYTAVPMTRANYPRDFERWSVIAYWPIALPAPFAPPQEPA